MLPISSYSFGEWEIGAETASRRRMSGEFKVRNGKLWSGDRSAFEASLSFRPLVGVTATAEWEHEDIDLYQGQFTTNLVRTLGSWHVSPWVSFDGNLQYDTVTGIAGVYTRLRWILRPGSDFYFVYTENWKSTDDRWQMLSRGATTKVNYTHRF